MTTPTLQRVGEVVEATSQRFTVQCYRLYESPPLGSLVRTGDPTIYAVVSDVSTEALDPGRPVIARGEREASEEDLYRNNPQLERLLCTRFTGLTVGYRHDGGAVAGLPPLPPRIHSFIYLCPGDEVEALTGSLDFVHLLLNGAAPSSDEVIVACLRLASKQAVDGQGFLVRAGQALAMEMPDQLPRLNAILRRLA